MSAVPGHRKFQSDGDGFRSAVRTLAETLHVKVAFVCEVVGEEHELARTLALSGFSLRTSTDSRSKRSGGRTRTPATAIAPVSPRGFGSCR